MRPIIFVMTLIALCFASVEADAQRSKRVEDCTNPKLTAKKQIQCLQRRVVALEAAVLELQKAPGVKTVKIQSSNSERRCLTDYQNVGVNLVDCNRRAANVWTLVPSRKKSR